MKKEIVLLVAILVLALGLRVWGSNFGLPYEYHVDEDQYVRQAATMGEAGLKPANWYNPPFFKYLLLAEYGGLYAGGRLLGVFASAGDFGARMRVDPTWLYLLGRWTSALLGTLTVLVTYWTGKAAYSRAAGLISAALLAVAFLPVRETHFAVNDAGAALWTALALLAAVQILKTGEKRWYLFSGAALGFGFATKYHVLIALVPLLIAHCTAPGGWRRRAALGRLGILLIAAIGAALLASPYFILAPGEVWRDLYWLVWSGNYGYEGWLIDPAGGFWFYLKTFVWGLGWPLTLLCLAGCVAALVRRRAVDFVMISLPLVLFFYLGRQSMYFGRFMLPAVPPLLIAGAALLDAATGRWFPRRWLPGPKAQQVALAGLTLLAALPPLISAVRFDHLLTLTDTRTLAKRWIEANLPDGTRVAMDWLFHCPSLSTADRPTAASPRTYQVWLADLTLGKGLSDHPLDWYRVNGYQYLVACSSIYRIPLEDPELDLERQAFYASLDSQLTLVQEFKPASQGGEPPFIFDEIYGPAVSLWQRERPGPTIKVYQVNP